MNACSLFGSELGSRNRADRAPVRYVPYLNSMLLSSFHSGHGILNVSEAIGSSEAQPEACKLCPHFQELLSVYPTKGLL